MAAYNKFIVALLMAGAEFTRASTGIELPFDEATADGLVGLVTAVLVYLVPNKAA